METFSALLAICAGNSSVTGEFPAQRAVTRSVDVFFDLPWMNDWENSREADDLRRHRAHYDVTVMPLSGYQLFIPGSPISPGSRNHLMTRLRKSSANYWVLVLPWKWYKRTYRLLTMFYWCSVYSIFVVPKSISSPHIETWLHLLERSRFVMH